jgi:hypothetical protein
LEHVGTYRAALPCIAPSDRLSASKTAFSYHGCIVYPLRVETGVLRLLNASEHGTGKTVTACHALQRVRRPIRDPIQRRDSTKKGRSAPSFDCMLLNIPLYMPLSRSAFRSSVLRYRMICAAVLIFRRLDPRRRFFRMLPKDPASPAASVPGPPPLASA